MDSERMPDRGRVREEEVGDGAEIIMQPRNRKLLIR